MLPYSRYPLHQKVVEEDVAHHGGQGKGPAPHCRIVGKELLEGLHGHDGPGTRHLAVGAYYAVVRAGVYRLAEDHYGPAPAVRKKPCGVLLRVYCRMAFEDVARGAFPCVT